jgi:hypothetical protein
LPFQIFAPVHPWHRLQLFLLENY